jgi:hypothetical protein
LLHASRLFLAWRWATHRYIPEHTTLYDYRCESLKILQFIIIIIIIIIIMLIFADAVSNSLIKSADIRTNYPQISVTDVSI